MKEIAKALSELPKKNAQHPRVVIITQGADPTVLAIGRNIFHWFILELFLFALIAGKDIQEFPVKKPSNIVDTNGAGDSFVGGMFYIDVEWNILIRII